MERGRPTAFKPEYIEMAKVACRLGAIDLDLAEMFGVTEQTINNWKNAHPEFFEALKQSKDYCDNMVEAALYKRAMGLKVSQEAMRSDGEIVELKKELPPDTGACVVWLANRRPAQWKKDPGGEKNVNSIADSLAELIDRLPD